MAGILKPLMPRRPRDHACTPPGGDARPGLARPRWGARRRAQGRTLVHGPCVTPLGEAAKAAGFQCHFSTVGMEQIDPTGFGVALINPPFSLHLEAPTLWRPLRLCVT